jgi:spore germination protein YaaH
MNNSFPDPLQTGSVFPVKRKQPGIMIHTLALLLMAAVCSVTVHLAPGLIQVPWGSRTVVVIGNQKAGEGKAKVEEREIYIHVEILRSYLDPNFFWDAQEKIAVITTADRVIHMYSETLSAEINLQPVELQFPLREEEDGLYLPLCFLADYYELQVGYHPETDTLVIDQFGDTAHLAVIGSRSVRLRERPGLHHPYLTVLERGEKVRVQELQASWSLVRTAGGLTGYIPRNSFYLTGPFPLPEHPPAVDAVREKQFPRHPLVMTWEFAYTRPNINTIGPMAPLQVISPTWFQLRDAQGNLSNRADPAYAHWAKERGYLIWALASNDFHSPGDTAQVLASSTLRRKVINQLLIYARLYELDGLNIDFENFHYQYRDYFTQFIRELAPLCRSEGLVLSVDLTMISMEPYWSRGYDRRALAEAADYVILMAYDEHWENGPVPGPVASLPWVERGLQKVLQEVDAEKLILGVPFYTRLWQVENLAGGGENISSKSYSMVWIDQLLAEKKARFEWDSRALQHMAEYSEDGSLYKVWLEDAASLTQRLELVNRYRLAGVAGWRRGLEKPETWELISTVLAGYGQNR